MTTQLTLLISLAMLCLWAWILVARAMKRNRMNYPLTYQDMLDKRWAMLHTKIRALPIYQQEQTLDEILTRLECAKLTAKSSFKTLPTGTKEGLNIGSRLADGKIRPKTISPFTKKGPQNDPVTGRT